MEITLTGKKDLGRQRVVPDALPTAVVRGAWEGSLDASLGPDDYLTVLSHVVPAGKQLKILFLRVYTQNPDGCRFAIVQTNPTAAGQTGDVEAYPVVGSAPAGVVDYPFLEAAGCEVLRGSLEEPVHVVEGSIDFRLLGPLDAAGYKYGVVWWGVEDTG